MQDGSVAPERLKTVTWMMAFSEDELHRLRAKAAENGLDVDGYVNDLVRRELARTAKAS